ncbi:hypothetical protein ACFL7D_09995 [candidate division KSB1 bacterium]
MEIDLTSTAFGCIITLAVMIIFNRFYYGLFGGKEMRKLRRENRDMKKSLDEKDKYIKKSLDELNDEVNSKMQTKEQ